MEPASTSMASAVTQSHVSFQMLLQVGKFYEAVGLDALLLVEYGALSS
jgi:hypothetical protein